MANARSTFDMIGAYLQRAHEVDPGLLYGKPSLSVQGRPFAAYQPDAMAFHLHGRVLAQALGLPGARPWDPLDPDGATPGWVLLPLEHALRWNRYALEALRCEREAIERRVSYAVPDAPTAVAAPGPAASSTSSLAERVKAATAAGFGALKLTPAE